MKKNLNKVVLAPLGVALALSMIFTTYLVFHIITNTFSEKLDEDMENMVSEVLVFVEDYVDSMTVSLQGESKRRIYSLLLNNFTEEKTERISFVETSAYEHIKLFADNNKYLKSLAVINLSGDVVAGSGGYGMTGINIRDRDYFNKFSEDKPVVTGNLVSKISGANVFAIATPVYDGTTHVGFLLVTVDLGLFSQSAVVLKNIGDAGYAYVLDSKGLFVAHPDPKLIKDGHISDYAFFEELEGKYSGFFEYEFKGDSKFAFFKRSDDLNWVVVVATIKSKYFAKLDFLQYSTIAVMLLNFIFIALFAKYKLQKLVFQITKLKNDASLVSDDLNADVDFESSYSREFNSLGTSMQHLVGTLLMKISEIDKARKKGEKEAEKRLKGVIAELQETNIQVGEYSKNLETSLGELKETQSKMLEAEKQASLGRLVAGVAHEINTPLGVSITYISFLLEKYKQFYDDYSKGNFKRTSFEAFCTNLDEGLTGTEQNLMRTAELVKSFKMISADQTSKVMREIELYEYLEEGLRSLSPNFKRTKIAIDLKKNKDIIVNTYPGTIMQVVTNIIMNSLKHAFEAGAEGVIKIVLDRDLENVIMVISDNGRGMAPDTIEHVFDPFYTTARDSGGTGLGAHIVYNLVTQVLQGTVICESDLGEGTVFTIKIPINLNKA